MNDNTSMAVVRPAPRILHIRFDGRSWDLDLATLDLGDVSTDSEVRAAAANALDVPPVKLASYQLEREADGHMTLRPQASFGCSPLG